MMTRTVGGPRVLACLLVWVLTACTGPGPLEAARPTEALSSRPPADAVSLFGTESAWFLEQVTPDGLTVWVITPTGSCTGRGAPDLVETDDEVRLVTRLVQPRGDGVCEGAERHLQHRFRLARPLGDRLLTGCRRPDCRSRAELGSEPAIAPLALDSIQGDVVLAGTVHAPDGDQGRVAMAAGIARLDASTGRVVWGTPYERLDGQTADPLGAPRVLDDLVAVDLDASGGLAMFRADGAGPVALVNGMSGDGRHAVDGLWLGNQKLTANLLALDLTRIVDAWGGGRPIDFAPSLRWAVEGEAVVAGLERATGSAVVVTQDRGAGAGVVATVRARTLPDGELLGGGVMGESTRLWDAGPDAQGRLVAVGTAGRTLIAVDVLTGQARWQIDADQVGIDSSEITWVRVLSDSLMLVLAGDRLHALDMADGSGRWEAGMDAVDEGGADARFAVADGLLILAGAGGVVQAHDLADGTEVWSTSIITDQRFPVPTPTTPTVIGGAVVVGVDDGAVGLDVRTGQHRWSMSLAEALAQ